MPTANLIRWSGPISILAGVLFALAAFLHPSGESLADVNSPNWVPAHVLGWVSLTLMPLGLVGLYARQAAHTGWLGLVGFVLAFIGTAFAAAIQFLVATVIPLIAAEAPALFERATAAASFAAPLLPLGFVLGYILFGAATIRAGVLPHWSGLLLIVGVVLFMIGELSFLGRDAQEPALGQLFGVLRSLHPIFLFGDVVFGLGLVWMGYALWSKKRELPS